MIRPARPEDVPAIAALVRELAEYERAAHLVDLDEADLEAALFGPSPAVFAHVAEHEATVVGMAVWFRTFSTWSGRHGIYLEDLVVSGPYRGLGLGRGLLAELARIAVASGYARVEWAVLDWNEPAIGFYRHLGAEAMDQWTVNRITGAALRRLAGGAEEPSPGLGEVLFE